MRNLYVKWQLITSTAACHAASGLSVVIITLVVLAINNFRLTSGLQGLTRAISESL